MQNNTPEYFSIYCTWQQRNSFLLKRTQSILILKDHINDQRSMIFDRFVEHENSALCTKVFDSDFRSNKVCVKAHVSNNQNTTFFHVFLFLIRKNWS